MPAVLRSHSVVQHGVLAIMRVPHWLAGPAGCRPPRLSAGQQDTMNAVLVLDNNPGAILRTAGLQRQLRQIDTEPEPP